MKKFMVIGWLKSSQEARFGGNDDNLKTLYDILVHKI